MTQIVSAWPNHPDYSIEAIAWRGTARAWRGDVLLAESTAALRLTETRHVDRLYFPDPDIRWEHLVRSDLTTVCPFKGEAGYWSLLADSIENVAWSYAEPFDEVAAIRGHTCFYDEHVRVELIDPFPSDTTDQAPRYRWPIWGDAADLAACLDVEVDASDAATGGNERAQVVIGAASERRRFVSPAYRLATSRNVVEGGHQLAQAVVAAAKAVPDQRVTSAHMVFSKSAGFHLPLDLDAEVLHRGQTMSVVEVRTSQSGRLRSTALVQLDASPSDTIRHDQPMPALPGPWECEPLDMWVTGRDIRVVDGAYDPDPERNGPPELFVWCRFRDRPATSVLHAALMAQSTTHWTIAAGMRPHAGVGEAQAHVSLSTGVLSATVTFLDEVDVTDWLLYSTRAVYAGRGLVQGEGLVHAADGRVVGTYSIQTMVRSFWRDPNDIGLDASNAM